MSDGHLRPSGGGSGRADCPPSRRATGCWSADRRCVRPPPVNQLPQCRPSTWPVGGRKSRNAWIARRAARQVTSCWRTVSSARRRMSAHMPVIDASVAVDWVAPDSDPEGPARQLLDRLTTEHARLLGPSLLAARSRQRPAQRRPARTLGRGRGGCVLRAAPAHARPSVDEARDLERAYELSRRFDEHPVYDMLYLALAERRGESLYTADARLAARLQAFAPVVLVG